MLNIYFGDMDEAIYNTSVYFKNTYLDSWLEDPFAQQMIKSIDRARVIGPSIIESPVLGMVPPTQLSGGVKTLLLIYNLPDMVFNASTCGDNCAFWILRIAKHHESQNHRDITINLHHLMNFGRRKFSARVLNSGNVVHDMEGLLGEAADALEPQPDIDE